MTTTAFRIDFMEPAMGMYLLMSDSTTPIMIRISAIWTIAGTFVNMMTSTNPFIPMMVKSAGGVPSAIDLKNAAGTPVGIRVLRTRRTSHLVPGYQLGVRARKRKSTTARDRVTI
jgi:hypothetical protein